MSMDLLKDLKQADNEARGIRPCPICVFIENEPDAQIRVAVRSAADAESKIGARKLADILSRHELGIGRRTIIRHRAERHTP